MEENKQNNNIDENNQNIDEMIKVFKKASDLLNMKVTRLEELVIQFTEILMGDRHLRNNIKSSYKRKYIKQNDEMSDFPN